MNFCLISSLNVSRRGSAFLIVSVCAILISSSSAAPVNNRKTRQIVEDTVEISDTVGAAVINPLIPAVSPAIVAPGLFVNLVQPVAPVASPVVEDTVEVSDSIVPVANPLATVPVAPTMPVVQPVAAPIPIAPIPVAGQLVEDTVEVSDSVVPVVNPIAAPVVQPGAAPMPIAPVPAIGQVVEDTVEVSDSVDPALSDAPYVEDTEEETLENGNPAAVASPVVEDSEDVTGFVAPAFPQMPSFYGAAALDNGLGH